MKQDMTEVEKRTWHGPADESTVESIDGSEEKVEDRTVAEVDTTTDGGAKKEGDRVAEVRG